MFTIRHSRPAQPLTGAGLPTENSVHWPCCPSAHAPGDLAGVPVFRNAVPALHSTYRLSVSMTRLRRAVAHNCNLWRPGMAKATNGKAATALGGALRSGGHPGAAQPPLDLSLGHIGTIHSLGRAAEWAEDIGPFRVFFDPATRKARVLIDRSAFANREERRAAEREFRKVAMRIGRETGFTVDARRTV